LILNNVCVSGQPSNQCLDTQAECVADSVSVSFKCLCKDDYFENSGDVCTQSKLSFLTNAIILKGTMCYISACIN
jgi:hypothetical protein